MTESAGHDFNPLRRFFGMYIPIMSPIFSDDIQQFNTPSCNFSYVMAVKPRAKCKFLTIFVQRMEKSMTETTYVSKILHPADFGAKC